jgi:hypothetical protein
MDLSSFEKPTPHNKLSNVKNKFSEERTAYINCIKEIAPVVLTVA